MIPDHIDLAATPIEEMTDESLLYWEEHYGRLFDAALRNAEFLAGILDTYMNELERRGLND